MDRRNPKAFPRDDRRVYDAYIAGREAAAIAVGVRIGLFELLEKDGPLGGEDIRARLGYHARPMRALLVSLLGMGLLEKGTDGYRLAPDASDYLVRGKPGWLGGLIDLEIDSFLSPRKLLDALESGKPGIYGNDADPWEVHEADPARARAFTEAMHSISERPAAGLAEVVDFSGVTRLLDAGGGSGAISLAVARAWPDVRCVILDLPVVCPIVREHAEAAGLADRVTALPGDLFAESFPSGFDAILFSQILHDWPVEKDEELVRKAHAALPPGGMILIHEKLVDEQGRPFVNALVNLDMSVWTDGQQFSEAELRAMLGAAGFVDVERRATAGYWSVVTARKPEPAAS